MGAAYFIVLFVAYIVVIFSIILPLFSVLAKTSFPIAVVVFLLIFLLVPPLIALGIQFLITRALEWGRTMFSRGKINIAIQKTNYAPGDTISGNVTLTLKKPVNARGVSIFLIGEQITEGGGGILKLISSRGSMEVKRERDCFYDYKQLLDGEKEYSEGREYPFEIEMPADTPGIKPQKPSQKGKLGEVQKVAKKTAAITGLTPFQEAPESEGKQNRWLEIAKKIAAGAGLIRLQRTKWYLLAKLDIPHGLDISKKVNITIG
jgi:hypothetical protein